MDFEEKMAPGQEPYTEEQKVKKEELLRGACEAAEMFDEDDLEDYSDRRDRCRNIPGT